MEITSKPKFISKISKKNLNTSINNIILIEQSTVHVKTLGVPFAVLILINHGMTKRTAKVKAIQAMH